MSDEAKQCPWCERWCLKDKSCNYIFSCGLASNGMFHVNQGCGRSWCFHCGKKFCGQYNNPKTGEKLPSAREQHDADCCKKDNNFSQEAYCCGGHNSHCEKRW